MKVHCPDLHRQMLSVMCATACSSTAASFVLMWKVEHPRTLQHATVYGTDSVGNTQPSCMSTINHHATDAMHACRAMICHKISSSSEAPWAAQRLALEIESSI